MNTYDPADYIRYVSIGTAPRAAAAPAPEVVEHRLPSGYADASPRTRLRGRAADRSPTGSRRSLAS